MIRVKGRYNHQSVELDLPLDLPEGTEVEVEIRPVEEGMCEAWAELGMDRLEAEWDNPEDAIYDDWKTLYDL